MPLDPIDARRWLVIEVAHEMTSSRLAAPPFIDDLVDELVDRTGERYALIAQMLYRAIMTVNLEGQRRAREFEGVDPRDYLTALSPDLADSMREFSRRREERSNEARKDKSTPSSKRSNKGGFK